MRAESCYLDNRKIQLKYGKLYLLGPFNEIISNEIIPELDNMLDTIISKNSPFEIIINSNGGYTFELMSLLYYIDILKNNNVKIITKVIGTADSCASMLACYGDERYMYKYSTQLLHFGTYPYGDIYSLEENKRLNKNCGEHFERIIDIYSKHSNLKKNQLKKLLTSDKLIFNAEECLKYNLCDYIV